MRLVLQSNNLTGEQAKQVYLTLAIIAGRDFRGNVREAESGHPMDIRWTFDAKKEPNQ